MSANEGLQESRLLRMMLRQCWPGRLAKGSCCKQDLGDMGGTSGEERSFHIQNGPVTVERGTGLRDSRGGIPGDTGCF
jgi:hypothetical protein